MTSSTFATLDAPRGGRDVEHETDPLLDELVQLAATVCGTRMAAVSIIDEHRQTFTARLGVPFAEIPRETSLCATGFATTEIDEVVLEDARDDVRFASHPMVAGDPRIRFYVGVRVAMSDGDKIGTLCVMDPARRSIDRAQLAALRVVGRQVATHLELRAQSDRLRRAEAELAANRARLAGAIELARLCVFTADLERGRMTFSGPLADILGVPVDEVTPELLERSIHPEDRALVAAARAEIIGGGSGELTFRFVRGDGALRWTHLHHRVDEPGLITGAFRDITTQVERERALAENELRLSTVLDRIRDGVTAVDRDLRFTYLNPEASRQLAHPPGELLGRSIFDVFPIPLDHPFRDALVRALDLQQPASAEAFVDQLGKWFSISIYPSPEGITIFSRDVTAARELEAHKEQLTSQLRALMTRLEQVREDEGRRISRELHDELGQELTVLKLDVVALQRGLSADDPQRPKLRELAKSVDTTIDLVRRIATNLRPRILDDLGLVAAVQWQVNEIGRRTALPVTLHVPHDELVLPEAISIAFFRALQELLTNVARHAAATRIVVTLAVVGDDLVLDVVDDGVGLRLDTINPTSLGLVGIRERLVGIGGALRITPVGERGTHARIRAPITRRSV